jgi:Transposase
MGSRSKLAPFVRVARTIRERLHGVLAYLNTRLSNGRSEGLNGKVRVITRRLYGLHCCKQPHRHALPVLLAPGADAREGPAEFTPTLVLGESERLQARQVRIGKSTLCHGPSLPPCQRSPVTSN